MRDSSAVRPIGVYIARPACPLGRAYGDGVGRAWDPVERLGCSCSNTVDNDLQSLRVGGDGAVGGKDRAADLVAGFRKPHSAVWARGEHIRLRGGASML